MLIILIIYKAIITFEERFWANHKLTVALQKLQVQMSAEIVFLALNNKIIHDKAFTKLSGSSYNIIENVLSTYNV